MQSRSGPSPAKGSAFLGGKLNAPGPPRRARPSLGAARSATRRQFGGGRRRGVNSAVVGDAASIRRRSATRSIRRRSATRRQFGGGRRRASIRRWSATRRQFGGGRRRASIRRWSATRVNSAVVGDARQFGGGRRRASIRRWSATRVNSAVVGDARQFGGGRRRASIRRWSATRVNSAVVGGRPAPYRLPPPWSPLPPPERRSRSTAGSCWRSAA